MAACSGGDKTPRWTVSGTIEGAPDTTVYVARYVGNRWVAIDSARTDADGAFSISKERMDYPDIYRVALGADDSIEFPIDSVESVTVKATAGSLATGVIGGSQSAELMQKANDIIAGAISADGAQATVSDSTLKRRLYDEIIMAAPGNIAAFQVITKVVDGKPLFNPEARFDFNIIRAVANMYNQYRPADPRTAILAGLVRPKSTVVAQEVSFPEISLMGLDGKNRKLSDLTGHGKPVVVCFTAYALDITPALNQTLAFAYHNGDADIYQISFDANEMTWRETANNLPWTCVYNTAADGDRVLRTYNVGDIPTIYIIDRNGNLAERVEDLSKLESTIKKY